MSAELNKLRTKINSTKTTKKITKAMELVSQSKMKTFQNKAKISYDFEIKITELIKNTKDPKISSIYTQIREQGFTFFVLFTSDKGLCGSLNTKLINTVLNSDVYKNTKKENMKFIIIGKKGLEFAKNNNLSIFKYYKDLKDNIDTIELINIIDNVVKLWDQKVAKNIFMAVPEFINTMSYYPRLIMFLPHIVFDNKTADNTLLFENNKNFVNKTNTNNQIIDNTKNYEITNNEETFNYFEDNLIDPFENNLLIDYDTYFDDSDLEDDFYFYKNENLYDQEYELFENENLIKNIVYEPNSNKYLESLFNKMIFSKFVYSFLNLKASEYSSRMVAMKNATDSASEMIQKYNLRYNKARQEFITNEISEIVGANL